MRRWYALCVSCFAKLSEKMQEKKKPDWKQPGFFDGVLGFLLTTGCRRVSTWAGDGEAASVGITRLDFDFIAAETKWGIG